MDHAWYQAAVGEGRVIYVSGEISEELVDGFRKQMREVLADPARKEIVVVLSSIGGRAIAGRNLHHDLVALGSGHTLWIVCQSSVRSMGVYILMAAPKERRLAFPGVEFYIHQSSLCYGFNLEAGIGEHEYRLKEYAAAIANTKREQAHLAGLLARGTGLRDEQVQELFDSSRHIYEAEAIELGLIGGILG